MWNIINRVTRKAKKYNHVPHLFKVNNMEIPIEKSAKAINSYFFNITDNLEIQTDFDISPISLLKNVYQNGFSQMNVIPVTEGEIQSIISSMKAKDSSGYDGISTKILKICNS
jgi:hypothetical protein